MDVFKNDTEIFKQFLLDFSRDHSEPITEDDPLPIRLLNYYLSEDEVEAEVLDWTLQYLTANGCRHLLGCLLARAVAESVLAMDLSSYIQPPTPNVETVCDGVDLEENESPRDMTPQIEVSQLARVAFSQLHVICGEWSKKMPEIKLPNRSLDISYHAIKNTRRRMEDKHVTLPYINYLFGTQETSSSASYFAVFDGHAGIDAAVYASAHLHKHLLQHSAYSRNPLTAMKDAVSKTDTDFCKKANRESLKSGSTGVFALIKENKLHLGWVGDSQIMMVRDGEPMCLMEPHKPEREDERKRIEGVGGCVIQMEGAYRVNGSLSVSRAIGDVFYRPYISGDADVSVVDLDGTEDYIVLACDGLWDTVSHDMVVSHVYDYLKECPDERAGIAKKLVMLAKERHSSDNISVVVIFLRDKIAIPKSRSQERVPVAQEEDFDDDDIRLEESQCSNTSQMESSQTSQISDMSISGENQLDSSPVEKEEVKEVSVSEEKLITESSSSPEPITNSYGLATITPDPSPQVSLENASSNKESSNKEQSQNRQSGDLSGAYANSPVLCKLKNDSSQCESSPELSNNNSKKVMVDLPLLEKLHISPSQSPELSGSQNQGSSNLSTKAHQHICTSDKTSDTSSTDIALLSQSASKCLHNRRSKRSKNQRRKNLREIRRSSKDKLSPLSPHSPRSPMSPTSGGIAHRTNNTPPRSRHLSESSSAYLRTSIRLSQQLGGRSPGDHLIEMLTTGYSPQVLRKLQNVGRSRWTVAVEIESGNGMFGE